MYIIKIKVIYCMEKLNILDTLKWHIQISNLSNKRSLFFSDFQQINIVNKTVRRNEFYSTTLDFFKQNYHLYVYIIDNEPVCGNDNTFIHSMILLIGKLHGEQIKHFKVTFM